MLTGLEPVFSGSATPRSLARHSFVRNGLKNANRPRARPGPFGGSQTGHPTRVSWQRDRGSLRRGAGLIAPLLVAACSTEPAPTRTTALTPAPAPHVPASGSAVPERVHVPGGSFISGTEPDRFERVVKLEPRSTRVALGPFEMDVEPYPGNGRLLLGLSRDQAADRCADRRGRLCTELEWERACKGPASNPFPTGDEPVTRCATAKDCASGFGVHGMGQRLEWTASELPSSPRSRLARGAREDAPSAERRCAHRQLLTDAPTPGVAFRCCYGPPNAARVVLPQLGRAFERATVTLDELGRWLASDPATTRLARELSLFPEPDATRTVLARGGVSQAPGVTTSALRWNPAAGVELVVVAARSGLATSFVAAFDAHPDGRHRPLASFILENEVGPVALGYEPRARDRLRFGTCWGCLGEMGRLLYREPDRVAILQP